MLPKTLPPLKAAPVSHKSDDKLEFSVLEFAYISLITDASRQRNPCNTSKDNSIHHLFYLNKLIPPEIGSARNNLKKISFQETSCSVLVLDRV